MRVIETHMRVIEIHMGVIEIGVVTGMVTDVVTVTTSIRRFPIAVFVDIGEMPNCL